MEKVGQFIPFTTDSCYVTQNHVSNGSFTKPYVIETIEKNYQGHFANKQLHTQLQVHFDTIQEFRFLSLTPN